LDPHQTPPSAAGSAHPVPYRERWYEDYPVGEVAEFGDHLVTEAEVLEFARRYDPQPFHTDPTVAADSIYGGIIGSGWMTCAIAMRLMVDHYISPQASMGSPGIDALRWIKPVRPGDRLSMRVTVLESRVSQSKPDRGMILLRWEALNQDRTTVMSMDGWGMYRRRPTV